MRSICLLGVQVAVEGKGWMVLAIDNGLERFWFRARYHGEGEGIILVSYINTKRSHGPLRDTPRSLADA